MLLAVVSNRHTRHDNYENQFRAMFVVNCVVVRGERLAFKQNKKQTPRKSPKMTVMDAEVGAQTVTTLTT